MAEPRLPSDPDMNDCDFRCLGSDGEESSWHTVINTFVKAETVFMGIVCGLGMITNILAVCILLSYRSRLHLSARCAINRAVADMLILFTNVIDVLVNMQGSWIFSCLLCKLRSALAIIGPLVSSAMLMALAGDRFLEVCNPRVFLDDRSRLLRTVFNVAWCMSVVYAIPTFLQSEIFKEVIGERIHCVSLPLSEDTAPGQALRVVYIFLVCLVPLVTTWAFVFNILRHKSKYVIQMASWKENRSWRLPLFLSVAFTVCQLPFWMSYLVHELHCTPLSVFVATVSLPAVNAALNPVFCLYFMKDLLQAGEEETQMDQNVLSLKSLSTRSLEHHSSHISLK